MLYKKTSNLISQKTQPERVCNLLTTTSNTVRDGKWFANFHAWTVCQTDPASICLFILPLSYTYIIWAGWQHFPPSLPTSC